MFAGLYIFFNNEWRKVTYLVIWLFNLNALILFYIEKVYMVPLLVQMKNKIKKTQLFHVAFQCMKVVSNAPYHGETHWYMNCVHVPPIFFLVRCFQYLFKKILIEKILTLISESIPLKIAELCYVFLLKKKK